MLNIGCHLSISRGYLNIGKEALSIGANTFQFFSRNPRGSRQRALDETDIKALDAFLKEHEFAPILAHAPYTLNACSPDEQLRTLAAEMMAGDVERLEYLPGNYYNFHPGSHVGQGVNVGIGFTAAALNKVLQPGQKTLVLLETMSGSGSEIGGRFEELQQIIEQVEHQELLGVCLDTCHVHAAGYDIINGLDGVLAEFDKIIGLKRLKGIHLNDCLAPAGARKDRHAKIGEGYIGLDAITRVINHPQLRHLPFYLETPNEVDGYKSEIELLRQAYQET
ncbi:MAG: deoxyribonuclease IV [Saccharofermentanales bacterium]